MTVRMTIFRKLSLGFGIIVLLTVALTAFQLARFNDALRIVENVSRHDTVVYAAVNGILEARADMRTEREAALAEVALGAAAELGAPGVQDHLRRHEAALAEARQRVRTIGELSEDRRQTGAIAERRALWAELAAEGEEMGRALDAIEQGAARLFPALAEGRMNDALAARQQLVGAAEGTLREANDLEAVANRLIAAGQQAFQDSYREVLVSVLIALAIFMVVATAAAVYIGRSISMPLLQSIAMAERIGRGDLTQSMPVGRSDELGDLARALNDMSANLRQVATRTRGAAENLNSATAQIRASAQEQAAAVAEQLASIEQTTATLTEITQSGAHMSERAQEIIGGAEDTADTTEHGLRAVEDTVAAMEGIRDQVETVAENIVMLSQRTQAIGDIILTVNNIAERSHLLALNASIEAAAAGEHGKTFSVVAAEIKKLADQAKDATAQVRSNLGEIQQGINASVMLTEEAAKRVAGGRRQTEAAERTIRRMAESIQESVQAFQQIVAGINQHQIGLEQVMQALHNIRTASTQTAGTTRQLEGAAGNMNELSETLVGAVRNYNI